jgi:integrase
MGYPHGTVRSAMANNLKKVGNVYYFRRIIPTDLQDHYGKKEVSYSLRTKDLAEAKILRDTELVQTHAQDAAIRAEREAKAQPKREPVLLREYVLDPDTRDSLPSGDTILFDPNSPGEHVEVLLAGEPVALLAERPAILRTGDPLSENYRRQIKEARKFKTGLQLARAVRRDQPASAQVVPLPSSAPAKSTGGSEEHLAGLVQAWAKERKPQQDSIDTMERVVGVFYEHVGRIPYRSLTRAHIIQFKDKMLQAGFTDANADKHLTNIGTLLNYAAANDKIAANPAKGIKVGARKNAKGARLPFDLTALQAIFSSPVYASGYRPEETNWDTAAAYWFPLLSLFTGARLEEMAQLAPEDVYEETYFDDDERPRTAWVIRFTDDGEDQGVKTSGSVRRVPVHSVLIERGFIEFAQGRKGGKRIFAMTPDPRGREGANWGKWFGKYLRGACNVANPKMTFHSFRHTFKDTARARGIPKDVHDAITGHEGRDVADQVYGGLAYPLAPLVAAMNRYRVLGLELPAKAG